MKTRLILGLAALGAPALLRAQDVQVHAVVEVWATQMLSANLRHDKPEPFGYLANPSLNAAFREDGFTLRRAEVYLSGAVNDQLSWNLQADPNLATSAANPSILNDAFLTWKPAACLAVKLGQFKPLQTYEASILGSSDLVFYDRSLHARLFGDKRDRGVVASWLFGTPAAFHGCLSLGVVNGTSDRDGGKAADANAQKDWVARLELASGKVHQAGLYWRDGSTDVRETALAAGTGWSGPGYVDPPSPAQILARRDRTTNLGAYYVLDTGRWMASAEAITGLLGRRFPTVFDTTAAPVKRQHLDQRYLGWTLSGAWRLGRHWLTARYDLMDFNAGRDWYTATDPYTTDVATGRPTGADYTPRFTEAILGYNWLFDPARPRAGKVKMDLLHRSRNVLQPGPGQTGAQGGDSLVVSVEVGF